MHQPPRNPVAEKSLKKLFNTQKINSEEKKNMTEANDGLGAETVRVKHTHTQLEKK